ncbi:MAG: hypothetical protein HQ567_31900 [Candidatus Nealsonbacteria bacterium]|nr:hypothetical protein [Candidatus Nealsonbacteria bacterium]
MDHFKIRPLSEVDIDGIIIAAGGSHAHPDADRRDKPGSDYLLNETLIELKSLDDEGLSKTQRQAKLATLFSKYVQDRPVVVLDREMLPSEGQRHYDLILETPIKVAAAKARKQLKQSQSEHPSANASVLLVINNGYTALDHETLKRMVAHRVRNDTTKIDGIVVAGCYFYSDTFDSCFLWPMDYIPINLDRPFRSFGKLKEAWDDFAETFMTDVVQGRTTPEIIKGPVVDTQFDYDGVTFVKPAPPMGISSDFFEKGRPRHNSTGITKCPPVAIVFPEISLREWSRFSEAFDGSEPLFDDYNHWQQERATAVATGDVLKLCVPVTVSFKSWEEWRKSNDERMEPSSVFRYSAALFNTQVRGIATLARERTSHSILPARYVLAVTEEIGQDCANDISHIVVIRQIPGADPDIREVVTNVRIFLEHAVALASAYAIADGIESVLWQKDLTYAWV